METGFKDYRLKANDEYYAEEIKAVEVFNQRTYIENIDLIVFGQKPGTSMEANDNLTERERKIVLSTIQWLGTPVGQGFLEEINQVKKY